MLMPLPIIFLKKEDIWVSPADYKYRNPTLWNHLNLFSWNPMQKQWHPTQLLYSSFNTHKASHHANISTPTQLLVSGRNVAAGRSGDQERIGARGGAWNPAPLCVQRLRPSQRPFHQLERPHQLHLVRLCFILLIPLTSLLTLLKKSPKSVPHRLMIISHLYKYCWKIHRD